MNSALASKQPLLATAVPQPGGQASPAKPPATANHTALAAPTLHLAGTLVGQNLTQHGAAATPLAHPAPSMAPVTANMAQMAQNMSHHGNLSHVTQNSVTPVNVAASPNKSASTSSPLSLVADKPLPLALTRTTEKKEPDSTGHANGNGTVEPKSASNAPAVLKPQQPEVNKDKQDIAKTSPSTPKPPEKPSTPQKAEPASSVSSVNQVDGASQPKVATANEAPEKSPAKPPEPKLAPKADVAPTQSNNKPIPESANASQLVKAPTPQKHEVPVVENAKPEPAKPEEKREEPKVVKPVQNNVEERKEEVKIDKKEEVKIPKKDMPEPPKKEAEKLVVEKPKPEVKEIKLEEKKLEGKALPKVEVKVPKSTLKLATVTPPIRKRRQASQKDTDGTSATKKQGEAQGHTPDSKSKRNRTQVQLYQSPTPELTMATKLSASAGRSTPTKPGAGDDKLIVFYKNEYLAVRNAEGGFYVCQAVQNVYRTTRKIKIRWLSQDKAADPSGETYKPDFYDVTDMECVLTTLSLSRAPGGGGAQILKGAEEARARSILHRAITAERGGTVQLTEEHPDGLDLSLYKDESQLEKKSRKRAASRASPRAAATETAKDTASPAKMARTPPKRSPKSARAELTQSQTPAAINKRKPAGSTPFAASTSKTATAVTEKKANAKLPPKRTPVKKEAPVAVPTPPSRGRRAAVVKESKPSPAPVPSTSTGKTTRTPRKPPAKK